MRGDVMATFDKAIGTVLEHEGGYSFDPNDPGGETKYGISRKAYPGLDVKALTLDQAKAIYKRDYWIYSRIQDEEGGELAGRKEDRWSGSGSRSTRMGCRPPCPTRKCRSTTFLRRRRGSSRTTPRSCSPRTTSPPSSPTAGWTCSPTGLRTR